MHPPARTFLSLSQPIRMDLTLPHDVWLMVLVFVDRQEAGPRRTSRWMLAMHVFREGGGPDQVGRV